MFAYTCRPLLAGFVALGLGVTAGAGIAESLEMNVNGRANPPVGYVDFCRNFPGECIGVGATAPQLLTERTWRDLQEVNTLVNHIVQPATDLEIYQVEEVWTLPETYGDCEDYVLLKRKWLVERGWSTSNLLVTVVFDEVGEGHAVLLVRTSRGDFVLDNKTDALLPWYDTVYRFVKRQSVQDPNQWVSVGDPRWHTGNTATSR